MRTFLLFVLLFSFTASAQQPVTPMRVQITATSEETGEEVADLVRRELRDLRRVAIVEKRAEWRVVLAAARDRCGWIGALVVMDARGKSQLSIHTSDKSDTLAKEIVDKLNTEFFKK